VAKVPFANRRGFWKHPAQRAMPESFSTRLAHLASLQQAFARLLIDTTRRQLAEEPSRPIWVHVDGPPGHGKSSVLRQLQRQLEAQDEERVCAWVEAEPTSVHRQILSALARAAPPLRRLELRSRIVLAAAPGVLAQRYLPVSLLVLAVLLVLSDPRSLSPWGFLLAGLVAAVSVVAAWTGRQAPLRLARPALKRACRDGGGGLSIVLDDLDLAEPGEARRCLEDLRALTRDLPVAVYVGCDRDWLNQVFAPSAPLGRFFDLSITVPQHWKRLGATEAGKAPTGEMAGLEQVNPRLLLRHRLASSVLIGIYDACESGLAAEVISRWALLCLRWPRLAEFLATYPARIAHFRYEQQPPEAPPDIAGYFTNANVLRLLRNPEDKVALDEAALRSLLSTFPPRRPPVN